MRLQVLAGANENLMKIFCLLLGTIALISSVRAQNINPDVIYPANAGVYNVRDFGAIGDGKTDDTEAIQKALSKGLYSHRVVYLPNGTYLVSDTLKWNNGAKNNASGWGGFLQMQGQNRAKTIIRLKENAPGFGDENAPKAVVATGSGAGDGNKHYFVGEGNEAFENHLRDFTVDTSNNVGAMGVDFQASNCGAMRRISIRGQGFCGLSLMRRDNGPGLVRDVTIDGFAYGVRAAQELCHFTFENIQLTNQRVAGMEVRDAVFALHALQTKGEVPALKISGIALVNLFDANLQSAVKSENVAIECSGSAPRVFVRGLKTSGFAGSIRSRGEIVTNANVPEWSSDAPIGPHSATAHSLDLPVRDTPQWFDNNAQNWADAGEPSGKDDTAQIQAALNSGKSTVYFHYGTYRIASTLNVPPSVKRIMGIGTSLDAISKLPDGAGMFRFAGGKTNDLTIVDRFSVGGQKSLLADHADARTLVLQDLLLFDTISYRNHEGSGPIFIEDATATLRLDFPSQAWARQLNVESMGEPKVLNNGGTIWVLGWKSESAGTMAENRNGGKLEMWAGLPYTFGVPKDNPVFINDRSNLVASLAGMTFMGGDNPFFDVLVRDTQNGQTVETLRSQLPARGGAVFLPLYISTPQAQTLLPPLQVLAGKTDAAPANVAPAANAQSYALPAFMEGEKEGSATGNGDKYWRLEQVWPDDILKRDNYQPLVWSGQNWVAPDQKFGAASAKISNSNVVLGVRSAWGDEGDMAGSKLSALDFIAPQSGHYTLTGLARAGIWQGDNGVSLHFLKRDAQKMTRLKNLELPKDQDVELLIEADLAAGETLVLVPQIAAWYTGVNVDLKNLTISSGVLAANGEMKVGGEVTIGGQKYRIESIVGDVVVLKRL